MKGLGKTEIEANEALAVQFVRVFRVRFADQTAMPAVNASSSMDMI